MPLLYYNMPCYILWIWDQRDAPSTRPRCHVHLKVSSRARRSKNVLLAYRQGAPSVVTMLYYTTSYWYYATLYYRYDVGYRDGTGVQTKWWCLWFDQGLFLVWSQQLGYIWIWSMTELQKHFEGPRFRHISVIFSFCLVFSVISVCWPNYGPSQLHSLAKKLK